jgi:transposase
MHITGSSVYHPEKRYTYIEKASLETDPFIFEQLYTLLDTAEKTKRNFEKRMAQTAAQFPVISRFQHIPGVGLITASTFFAIVDTPWRFQTVKRLWKYNGLAVGRKKSNKKWLSRECLVKQGNRLLKDRIFTAAKNARRSSKEFGRFYSHKRRQVKTHAAAENEVARKIVSVMFGMWKNETDYDPALIA